MDFGDFLVHILDPERRDYYRLEDIWSDAPDVTGSFASESATAAES
ncbi:MAG: RsfS/YbeB/iojap family protein [Thermoanaerobaculia bacterium]|nr:RsfS/YbeB/iojap family protein [Thermoanaerobaculia bacterium]